MVNVITNIATEIIPLVIPKNIISSFESLCLENGNTKLFVKAMEELHNIAYNFLSETVINEYHKLKINGFIEAESREERQKVFNEIMKENDRPKLLIEHYPVLKHLLGIRLTDYLNMYKEIISNYNVDKQVIYSEMNKDYGEIRNIEVSMGDTHHGKSVAIISFENGKLVYKPRNMNTDDIIFNILDFIQKESINSLDYYFPKYLSKRDHSWQEFITRKDCTSIIEVHNYYYRAGTYIAIFYLLSSTDMHYENLISYGEYPIFIDLETIVQGQKVKDNDIHRYQNPFDSVLSASILPTGGNNENFDVNLSSLFTGEQRSKKQQTTVIKEDAEYDWIFENIDGLIKPHDNVVLLNGIEVEPSKVEGDLISGFIDTLTLIYDKKEEFSQVINRLEKNYAPIRQLLRATTIYGKFINASTHPNYLTSFKEFNKLFDILINKFNVGEHGFLRVENEVEDLKNGYIPSFYTLLDEKHLYSNNKIICDDYFSETPRDTILKKLHALDFEMINYQKRIIQMSFLTLYGQNDFIDGKETLNNKNLSNLTNKDVENMLTKYADKLIKKLTPFIDDTYSITIPYTTKTGFIIQTMDSELYHVGGLIWFLATYSKLIDDKYTLHAQGMFNSLYNNYSQIKNKDKEINISVYNGISSLTYLAYNLYKLHNDYSYRNSYVDLITYTIDYVNNKSLKSIDNLVDFTTGFTGVMYLICKIYLDECKDSNVSGVIRKSDIDNLGTEYYETISNMTLEVIGLAHGISGVCLTLSILYFITHNDQYIYLIKTLLNKENNMISKQTDINNSWCGGRTGIILSRRLMLDYIPKNTSCYKLIHDDFKKYKDETLSDDNLFKIKNSSLCHGLYGHIDIFNTIRMLDNDNSYNNKLFLKRVEDLNELELFQTSKYQYESFMIGSSGIAYTLMRLYNNIPSILQLDIYNR